MKTEDTLDSKKHFLTLVLKGESEQYHVICILYVICYL